MKWLLAGLLGLSIGTGLLWLSLAEERWTRQDTRSPVDELPSVLFTLDADAPVRGWLRNSLPKLAVRCALGRQLELYVVTGLDTSVEPGTARSVRFHFDNDEPVIVQWTQTANHQALVAPPEQARDLAERLSQAKRFVFAFVPFRAEPAAATFGVKGFAAHWQVLRLACGIT